MTTTPDDHEVTANDRGSVAVIVALAVVPMLIIGAVVAEVGVVFAKRQRLQSGVEAAALATARTWAEGGVACGDVDHYITANIGETASMSDQLIASCATHGDRRNGVITVAADSSTALMLGDLIGRSTASITATASVAIGSPANATGLRPLALCATHPALVAWTTSGFTDPSVHRINVESDGSTCAGDVPGNWAMVDFDGGNNSNATLQSWVVGGYPGTVDVPSTVSGDPGIPTPAIDLDSLIGSIVRLPVFTAAHNGGAGAEFDLGGFVAVEIIDVVMTGSAASRHVDLRFVTEIDGDEDTEYSHDHHYGISSWHLCALDGNGTCS